jgi:penicillin amidase
MNLRAFVVTLVLSVPAHADVVTYRVPDLERPAEILIDRAGVPHIYAGTHYDAFFVQGFNAARDRLWQIDLWRRRGLGRLAEVFGPDYVQQDRAARLFLFRGDMYREWLAYGSDAKRIAERFTAGINAYIALTRADPTLLPPEFGLLDYVPEPWYATDVVRIRSHGLWRNVDSEVARAKLVCKFGAEVDALRKRLEPAWRLEVPPGLDPCSIPDGVLDDYLLAKAPVTFPRAQDALAVAQRVERLESIGSNNWAVAPARTAHGRPILANDPHRAHSVPSLRYAVHLVAPGLDVIGAGEPALPGVSTGHNDRIAFGLTIFPIDQEDLYVYDTRAGGRRYRYGEGDEPFLRVRDTIAVRDAEPVAVELAFSRHGPIVYEDTARRRAFAVRAAWLEPGMAPYFSSIEYMRAASWDQFAAALNRWGAPALNHVYADVDGNIGYKAAGLFPRRVSWDGLLPVPGDGRHEWQGFFDMDALPTSFNPASGFVATANEMNLPPDFPIGERRVGFEWTGPWRSLRIHEVLASQPRHTLEDSLRLQRDYTSILALRLQAAIRDVDHPAAEMLRRWDGVLDADSAAAALFVVWYERHLTPALLAEAAPTDAAALIGRPDALAVLDLLAGTSPERDADIAKSLDGAWTETSALLGADPTAWRWGALHRIRFGHPLLERADAPLAERLALPVYERGGSGDTPNATTYARPSFDVVAGASWRFVAEVGAWDTARMTNAPGQSGDPRSPFYGNLLENWAHDDSVPLLYSRDAVEAAAVTRIALEPVDER